MAWRSPLDPERVMQVSVTRWQHDEQQFRDDQLTVEEPLELRIAIVSLAVIMRTPGHDRELRWAFCLLRVWLLIADDVLSLEEDLDDDGLPLANVLNITLRSQRQQEQCRRNL